VVKNRNERKRRKHVAERKKISKSKIAAVHKNTQVRNEPKTEKTNNNNNSKQTFDVFNINQLLTLNYYLLMKT